MTDVTMRPEPNDRPLYCVPDPEEVKPRRERIAAWALAFLLDHERLGWWLLQYALAFAVLLVIDHGEHLGLGETLFSLFGAGWFVHLFHDHERRHHRHDHHH